jgi:uncharacterized protein (TIGR00296 family)
MCRHCFDVLIRRLSSQHHELNNSSQHTPQIAVSSASTVIPEPFLDDLPSSDITCPLFVTWDKKKQSNNKSKFELRGCLGSLAPQPLLPAVPAYALKSALEDRRFPPISLSEVSQLRVGLSLLVKYEVCAHLLDWVVGTHGILLSWTSEHGRAYSATYLPEVAKDQGWTQQAAVDSLIRKAGWTMAITDALKSTIACTRYQSSKLAVTFDEYITHRRGDTAGLASGCVDALFPKNKAGVDLRRPECRIS